MKISDLLIIDKSKLRHDSQDPYPHVEYEEYQKVNENGRLVTGRTWKYVKPEVDRDSEDRDYFDFDY